jgi:hypothetical protein
MVRGFFVRFQAVAAILRLQPVDPVAVGVAEGPVVTVRDRHLEAQWVPFLVHDRDAIGDSGIGRREEREIVLPLFAGGRLARGERFVAPLIGVA